MSALTGFRVVELAGSVAGEYCGKLLADFGAEIIKLEAPECGSPTRAMAPIVADGCDGSGLFAYLNTNKQSVVLDRGSEADVETIHKLIGTADAVIDDRAIDWSQRHPDVVFCSITPFGQGAPAEFGNAKSINVFHATAPFPLDVAAKVGERAPLSVAKLERRVNQLVHFAESDPGLLPACSPEFVARLRADVPRFALHEQTLAGLLAGDSDYVALCHWNANIDNAWFWREADGVLRCGLMDWGCVSQMNLGMAIWGAMSGAETELWGSHLDELLQVFVSEFHRCGGPELDPVRLRRHTLLYAAAMGVAWLLGVPPLIRKQFEAMPNSRRHPLIRNDERIRAPLQMLSNLLVLWERRRVGDLLDAALAEERQ